MNDPRKQAICTALRRWIAQRPGLEFANYGDVKAYRSEVRSITKEELTMDVIFRAVRAGEHEGEIDAIFPGEAATTDPRAALCYSHVGQHSVCSYGWYCRNTRAATPEEYAPLLAELRAIYERGADPVALHVVKHWTRAHDEARRAAHRS